MLKVTIEQKIELVKKLDCAKGLCYKELRELVREFELVGEMSQHMLKGKYYLCYTDFRHKINPDLILDVVENKVILEG